MNNPVKVGISFGLISGIITTLGLLVGLFASTRSAMVVVGGILIIAIADAMSDALGIHLSEESQRNKSPKDIWKATISTFFTKFIVACTFLVPVLLFELTIAVLVSAIWGLALITGFSYYVAKTRKADPYRTIAEHILISIIVIAITYFVGRWINLFFA